MESITSLSIGGDGPVEVAVPAPAALQALCLVARLHQVAADPDALMHWLGKGHSEKIGLDDVLLCARADTAAGRNPKSQSIFSKSERCLVRSVFQALLLAGAALGSLDRRSIPYGMGYIGMRVRAKGVPRSARERSDSIHDE